MATCELLYCTVCATQPCQRQLSSNDIWLLFFTSALFKYTESHTKKNAHTQNPFIRYLQCIKRTQLVLLPTIYLFLPD